MARVWTGTTKWILHLAVVIMIILSDIINMETLLPAINDVELTDRLLIGLMLCIVTFSFARIIGALDVYFFSPSPSLDMNVANLAQFIAHRRLSRLPFHYKKQAKLSWKKELRKQSGLFNDWIISIYGAKLCTIVAKCVVAEKLSIFYFVFLGMSMFFLIHASWTFRQLDHIYVKHAARQVSNYFFGKDGNHNSERDEEDSFVKYAARQVSNYFFGEDGNQDEEDSFHFLIRSLSLRILEEFVSRKRTRAGAFNNKTNVDNTQADDPELRMRKANDPSSRPSSQPSSQEGEEMKTAEDDSVNVHVDPPVSTVEMTVGDINAIYAFMYPVASPTYDSEPDHLSTSKPSSQQSSQQNSQPLSQPSLDPNASDDQLLSAQIFSSLDVPSIGIGQSPHQYKANNISLQQVQELVMHRVLLDLLELRKTKKSGRRKRKARSKKRAKKSTLNLSKLFLLFVASMVALLPGVHVHAAVFATDKVIGSSNIAAVAAAAVGAGVAAASLTKNEVAEPTIPKEQGTKEQRSKEQRSK